MAGWHVIRSETRPVRKLTAGPHGFVAITGERALRFSADGHHWQPVTNPCRWEINSLCYSTGAYWAAGDRISLLRSENGQDWTLVNEGNERDAIFLGVASGPGGLVAASNHYTGSLFLSAGGLHWRRTHPAAKSPPVGVAYCAGRYLALFHDGILQSGDGQAWTPALQAAPAPVAFAADGEDLWVLMADRELLLSQAGQPFAHAGRLPGATGSAPLLGGELAATGGVIRAAVSGLLLRSLDGGQSWAEEQTLHPVTHLAGWGDRWAASTASNPWERPVGEYHLLAFGPAPASGEGSATAKAARSARSGKPAEAASTPGQKAPPRYGGGLARYQVDRAKCLERRTQKSTPTADDHWSLAAWALWEQDAPALTAHLDGYLATMQPDLLLHRFSAGILCDAAGRSQEAVNWYHQLPGEQELLPDGYPIDANRLLWTAFAMLRTGRSGPVPVLRFERVQQKPMIQGQFGASYTWEPNGTPADLLAATRFALELLGHGPGLFKPEWLLLDFLTAFASGDRPAAQKALLRYYHGITAFYLLESMVPVLAAIQKGFGLEPSHQPLRR